MKASLSKVFLLSVLASVSGSSFMSNQVPVSVPPPAPRVPVSVPIIPLTYESQVDPRLPDQNVAIPLEENYTFDPTMGRWVAKTDFSSWDWQNPKPLRHVDHSTSLQESLRFANMNYTASAPQAIRLAVHALKYHGGSLKPSALTDVISSAQQGAVNVQEFLIALNKGSQIYDLRLHNTLEEVFTQMGISYSYALVDERGIHNPSALGRESEFFLISSESTKAAPPFGLTYGAIKAAHPGLIPIAISTRVSFTCREMYLDRQVIYLREDDGTWTMLDDFRKRAAHGITDEEIMALRASQALYLNQH